MGGSVALSYFRGKVLSEINDESEWRIINATETNHPPDAGI